MFGSSCIQTKPPIFTFPHVGKNKLEKKNEKVMPNTGEHGGQTAPLVVGRWWWGPWGGLEGSVGGFQSICHSLRFKEMVK